MLFRSYSLLLALGGDVDAMTALGAALILAVVIFVLIVKKLPSSRLWHKVVLHDRSTSQRGFVSAETRRELIGREGTVLTELRPAGSVQLGEQVVDVISEGAFVAKGARVKVIAVNGARVVVRRCAP